MRTPPDDPNPLLERAAAGDAEALRTMIQEHHGRLRRMVALRLDPRLQTRIDPSDVLQDAYIDATEQLPAYVQTPAMPFFLWLRLVTGSRLAKLHRYHLGAQMRDVSREVPIFAGALPEASSAAIAAQLLGHESAPSHAARRAELRARVHEALDQMDPLDREALVLRHFEHLTSAEAAQVLGISQPAAGKRYVRALSRIKDVLAAQPGGLDELMP
jgi:RNA polymerase sigma-70 factor (ECF subfamily)